MRGLRWNVLDCPETRRHCDDIWHVSAMNAKRCRCGAMLNPARRNVWQRFHDKRFRRKINRAPLRFTARALIVGVLVSALVAIGLGFTIGRADAAADGGRYVGGPAVPEAPARISGDKGEFTIVISSNRRNLFGMRKVANDIEARTTGIDIVTRRGISCKEVYRTASACAPVRVANFGRTTWGGMTSRYDGNRVRRIDLNSYYTIDQHLAGHELLHVLGVDHHGEYGLCGKGRGSWMSRDEARVLDAHY